MVLYNVITVGFLDFFLKYGFHLFELHLAFPDTFSVWFVCRAVLLFSRLLLEKMDTLSSAQYGTFNTAFEAPCGFCVLCLAVCSTEG